MEARSGRGARPRGGDEVRSCCGSRRHDSVPGRRRSEPTRRRPHRRRLNTYATSQPPGTPLLVVTRLRRICSSSTSIRLVGPACLRHRPPRPDPCLVALLQVQTPRASFVRPNFPKLPLLLLFDPVTSYLDEIQSFFLVRRQSIFIENGIVLHIVFL
uniref:Uncharacterized protein n=1 Tax=Arundo donax TaxID=35708 RepID=A0A0A9CSB6_ARUDO